MSRRNTKWERENGHDMDYPLMSCCGFEPEPEDTNYTQRSSDSEYARTPAELKEDQIRKPSLSEGLSLREKI